MYILYIDSAKANLSQNEVAIQVDFGENYQDEIQSSHWAYSQITLFTCCVWSAKVPVQSICIVSDNLSHDKYSVHVYTLKNCYRLSGPKTKTSQV